MNSFISWIGGKKALRKAIADKMPNEFSRYVEVFGGAGWVLFSKDKHADMEVFNDYNSDLINLYRCIKYHCAELQRELSYFLNSRELFEDFKAQFNTRGMTDIQRAARFFMLIKTSYGSTQESYCCIKRNTVAAISYLSEIQNRLTKVTIENRDFEKLIKIYDRPGAFLYCDPPYYGTEAYYQVQFSHDDHIRLKNTLENVHGKFMLSYNDCEQIRVIYKDFRIAEVERCHNLRSRYDADKKYRELLIMNY